MLINSVRLFQKKITDSSVLSNAKWIALESNVDFKPTIKEWDITPVLNAFDLTYTKPTVPDLSGVMGQNGGLLQSFPSFTDVSNNVRWWDMSWNNGYPNIPETNDKRILLKASNLASFGIIRNEGLEGSNFTWTRTSPAAAPIVATTTDWTGSLPDIEIIVSWNASLVTSDTDTGTLSYVKPPGYNGLAVGPATGKNIQWINDFSGVSVINNTSAARSVP